MVTDLPVLFTSAVMREKLFLASASPIVNAAISDLLDTIQNYGQYIRLFQLIDYSELFVFDEYETEFQELIENPDAFIDELREYPAVFSPDLSLYRNAPLSAQITNVYNSRLTGNYLQRNGVNVVPFIRWGDERSFTTMELPEPFALPGAHEGSAIRACLYGCVKSNADQDVFRAGLIAAIERIHPCMVLSCGPHPDRIFGGLEAMTEFVFYEDWTRRMRRRHG